MRLTSTTVSAISFGVFWRLAPSTSAIIWSRNVSPGAAVICTTTWSERTRVEPVTALRSPPASRITGADSPVITDSSTSAMPSTISPSPGISSPASTTQRSPTSSSLDGFSKIEPSAAMTLASVVLRIRRSEPAWALPRPSASASAKLANSTVNHSHTRINAANAFSDPLDEPASRMNRIVAQIVPTYTTKMTGLRTRSRGSSFRKDSITARRTIVRSNADSVRLLRTGPPGRCGGTSGTLTSLTWSLIDSSRSRSDRTGARRSDRARARGSTSSRRARIRPPSP